MKVLALCGGVGGAKLGAGLASVFTPGELTIVVNTADDFVHWGLNISPDLDSVMYKLAGVNDVERGWGRAGESWKVLDTVKELGGEGWFQLGDRDLAVHLMRTQALAEGKTLGEVTQELALSFGINHKLVPMSDDPVATMISTDEGEISFQEYFVGQQCTPAVRNIRFSNIEHARPCPAFSKALNDTGLTAVLICPSNPFVSIDPILSLPGVRETLAGLSRRIPVVAVSPIIGGQAVKGPAAKMFESLGRECSAIGVAEYYRDFINGMVIDKEDASLQGRVAGIKEAMTVKVLQTMMCNRQDEQDLAFALRQLVSGMA